MAWFVERLLTNSELIHLRKIRKRTISLESDEIYNYLLRLEDKITDLRERGLLSDEEMELIKKLKENKTITQLSRELNLSRITTASKIDNLTDKLSIYLGGVYTDEGYLEYMKNRNNLTDKQVAELEEVIKGRYKRFYMR